MTDAAQPEPASADRGGKATGAGRGVLYIAFAKFYFILAGALIQIRLPSILSEAAVGAYQIIGSFVNPVNNVMITGSIQAVSRFTAQRPEHARLVQDAGLRMHFYIGLPVTLLFLAASPVIAWFQYDTSMIVPLLMAGAIVGGYSFYAIFVGTANGTRQFHKQAGLDVTFATMRVAGILGAATLGLGITGMIGGWIAAVGVILVVAALWVGVPRGIARTERLPTRPMVKFFLGVAAYLALFNLLMFVDTWLLKRLSTEYFHAHEARLAAALDGAVPWVKDVIAYEPSASKLADVQVAYYSQVQFVARLSYQAIIAATFVIFPLVSRSTFEGDRDTTKRYIHVTMRYSLMFATAIAVVMAANPTELLDVVYPVNYAELGGPALAVLALGNVAFSLFAIAGTILNGAGYTGTAIGCAFVTLVVAVVGNFIAIPLVEPGQKLLLVTAAVTAGAMGVGAAVTGYMLVRRLGAFLPVLSLVRVVVAVAVAIGVGRVLPFRSPLASLVEAAVIGVVFLVVLVATRELGKRDLDAIRAVRTKRGQGGDV